MFQPLRQLTNFQFKNLLEVASMPQLQNYMEKNSGFLPRLLQLGRTTILEFINRNPGLLTRSIVRYTNDIYLITELVDLDEGLFLSIIALEPSIIQQIVEIDGSNFFVGIALNKPTILIQIMRSSMNFLHIVLHHCCFFNIVVQLPLFHDMIKGTEFEGIMNNIKLDMTLNTLNANIRSIPSELFRLPMFNLNLGPVGNHSVGNHSVGNHSVGNHSVGNHSVENHSVGNHSVGNQPIVDSPIINSSIINSSIINSPIVDQPIVDQPIVDQPIVDQPIVDQPIVDQIVNLKLDSVASFKPDLEDTESDSVHAVVELQNQVAGLLDNTSTVHIQTVELQNKVDNLEKTQNEILGLLKEMKQNQNQDQTRSQIEIEI